MNKLNFCPFCGCFIYQFLLMILRLISKLNMTKEIEKEEAIQPTETEKKVRLSKSEKKVLNREKRIAFRKEKSNEKRK